MKAAINNFFRLKNHSHEDISREILYRNRLYNSVFFLILLTTAFTINYLSLYLYAEKVIPFKAVDTINELFAYIYLVTGLIFLPYHPRHYGFNLNRLKFNLVTGLTLGSLALGAGIYFRYNLFLEGHTDFGFYFNLRIFIRNIILYPIFTLAQEAVFRGYLQSYFIAVFENIKGHKLIANIISSLIFAQFHIVYGGLPVFAGAFALSLFLGFMYEKSRSLLGVTVIHFLAGASIFFFNKMIT